MKVEILNFELAILFWNTREELVLLKDDIV